MDFKEKIYTLLEYHCCLSNGVCDRDGIYVPVKDALEGDFDTNKRHFKEGETFPSQDQWIRVPASM